MQKLILILKLLPLLLLLLLTDKDVLGALILVVWCSGKMLKLSNLGHLHPIYYVNSGLLHRRKHLIFHFLLKELELCSSPRGASSFTSTICHITKHCFMLPLQSFIQPLIWQLVCLCKKLICTATSGIFLIASICNEEILTTGPDRFSQSNNKYTRNQPWMDKCSTKKISYWNKIWKVRLIKSNHHSNWFVYI